MLSKETKQRLSKLAQFLDKKVKSRYFNYAHYIKKYNGNAPDCGTIACAAGWASILFDKPMFLSGGLPKFFGLSHKEYKYLFYNSKEKYYFEEISKTRVIKRIRKFVKSNGKMPKNGA